MRPPPPDPPPLYEVMQSLRTNPFERSDSDVDVIFRHLIMNKKLVKMLENKERLEIASRTATLVTLSCGDILFQEGDESDGWYLVLTGQADVIVRICHVAEDCCIDPNPRTPDPYAPLMKQLDIDPLDDKLKQVNVLEPGSIFGHHSYLLDRSRTATIVAGSDTVDLIRFDPAIFRFSRAFYLQRDMIATNKELCRRAFPRLNDEKLTMLAAMSDMITLKPGTRLNEESGIGSNLYVIKSGTVKRYKVVDFSDLSFRRIEAPFEDLELQFPDGMRSVHTDNLGVGAAFPDPSIRSMHDSDFHVDGLENVEVISIDLAYFDTVVGAIEMRRVAQELRNTIKDEDVVRLWVDGEKKRLWTKFKAKEMKKSYKHMKGEKEFHARTVALRTPRTPKSMKSYRPKNVVPYASKSLRR